MKILVVIPIALLVSFCNSTKNTIAETTQTSPTMTINSACPEDGKCSIELLKNKSLIVKTDEIGATYYQIIDAPKTSVVLYQYNRIIEKGLQDGQYKEAVVFEITNSDTLISLLNSDLQKTKMLFGRHCFCKGQAGYQKVSKGSLELVQEKNSIQFNLDFQVTEVPQLIKSIKIATK